MATSQNGWPVVDQTKIDRTPIQQHVYPNGFLKGDVWKAFNWLFTQLNNRVEPVSRGNPPDEWGYYVKNIEGSHTISNHASGTAGDYNASEHPMGVPASHNYSTVQIAEIHKILREAHGIFRWGGDYTGRPDPMHFEIVGTPNDVHDFIVSISPQKDYVMNLHLDGLTLPTLHQGDDDTKHGGYNYVGRAQMCLNFTLGLSLKVDGNYGPATAAAVKALPTNNDGKKIELAEWQLLFGMVHA